MNAERWKQVDRIFHAALEREAGQRADFVYQACAGDETLHKEVESLVASHERAGGFIETPAADLAAEVLVENQTRLTGLTVGPYEIVNLLGAGGMGEVYLARDTRLGRRVALKLLPAQATLDEDRLRRFEREARAVSALNHPNIITIHEIGEVDDAHFIVTEFIEGNTLRQPLGEARVKLREALDVAIQVGSALEAAHKVGIVHRDIKPENIMLRPDGLVKVLDFGLAKLTQTQLQAAGAEASTRARTETEFGLVMGTVSYMSPEQARGLPVDARSDIFSLGIVIYEMIAGRPPFDGATTSDVIVSILEKEPPPLSQCAPEVTAEIEQVVNKALTKNLEGRYQNVKELLFDLRKVRRSVNLVTEQNAAETGDPERVATATADGLQLKVSTDEPLTIRTGGAGSVRGTSSAEYLVGEIKKHKRGAALGAFALVIAAVCALLFFSTNKAKPVGSNSAVKTIAVLPFKPLISDNSNESLELGMADTLINKLSGIRQLIVRPLSDVIRYKRLEQNPFAAGRALGVDYVLEGSLQTAGDKTRASVRLLNVSDESAIWTDKCDQQCTDVFEFQDSISERITAALALRLTNEERKQLTKHYTDSTEAYQLYSLGMYHSRKETREDLYKSIDYFEQAIKTDPNYALAYTGLVRTYSVFGQRGFWIPKTAQQNAEWAALKAVEIDDALTQAHALLGYVKKSNWDWTGAEKEFKRALELDPNDGSANYLYSAHLTHLGRTDEALVYARRADELGRYRQQAFVYLYAHEYDKAIERYVKEDVNRSQGNFQLAQCYLGKGMYDQAIAEVQKVIANDPAPEKWSGYPLLSYAYAAAGMRGEAIKILDEQKKLSKRGYIAPFNFAIIYTGLGDKDKAFDYLNKAYEEGSQMMPHFPKRPMFDSLHSDPRYAELLRRMNFPM